MEHSRFRAMYRPEIPADASPIDARPPRLARPLRLDGRTRPAKAAKAHRASLMAALGGTATPAQALVVDRAAMLLAIAEDARARRLAGDSGTSLDDIVRMDGAIRRCLRELGLGDGAKSARRPRTFLERLQEARR